MIKRIKDIPDFTRGRKMTFTTEWNVYEEMPSGRRKLVHNGGVTNKSKKNYSLPGGESLRASDYPEQRRGIVIFSGKDADPITIEVSSKQTHVYKRELPPSQDGNIRRIDVKYTDSK